MTIRKQSRRATVAAALPLLFAMPMALSADEGAERVRAHLVGYEEVPTLSSNGSAVFRAKIAEDEQSFDWVLTYTGLTNVTQSHIHFAARAINGPVVIWLCSNLGNGPAGTQACPPAPATVENGNGTRSSRSSRPRPSTQSRSPRNSNHASSKPSWSSPRAWRRRRSRGICSSITCSAPRFI